MLLRREDTLPPYVTLKRSKRARRLGLRLDPKERVFHLVVPAGVSLRRAERFAEEHDSWMIDKLMELPEPIPFEYGTVLPVLGQNRRIHVFYDETLRKTFIDLKDKELLVTTNKDDPSARIERYLKKLAKDELTMLAHEKAAQIRRKVFGVSVRDTKSRWGSCSADGNLSFSWRLLFAPYEAFDYVVAHEVAHLRHMDHSNDFWHLCRDLSEDFFEGEYWMREHGHELMRYGASQGELL
ncbi:MAG: SprT family zinc-dependent metalloprotease [Alphaproteobacteria bacterium]